MTMNSVKKNMIYNTVGSLCYYVCQWLTTILIVRISGYVDAGILSIAMSVTAAPAIIGLFNVRSYQVSDINNSFTDSAYIMSRTFTNILSFIVCVIMILINGYSLYKAFIILLYMCYKISEGYADVFYGIEQKNGRLDYTGISLVVRGIGSIVFFVVGYCLTQSLAVAILCMVGVSFVVILFFDYPFSQKLIQCGNVKKPHWEDAKNLLFTCFPLAVVAFLNNLSINIPKIYLENQFGEEIMGIFSSVASPTVIIQLAATTIFAPLVPILSEYYWNGKRRELLRTIGRFSCLIGVLSVVCLIGSKLLARWGLVLLFSNSIEPYVEMFVPIVCVSIFIALNACMFSVCTLLRIMNSQYLIGIVGVLSSLLFTFIFVNRFCMYGVIYALLGTLLSQILVQLVMIFYKLKRM